MRILVLAQKGDWTACESALKALERSVVENLLNEGARQPLARISDTVRPLKVEKILKDSLACLDSISLPSPSVKIQIMGGKVCLECKGKTLLGILNKLLKTKSLLTSPSYVLPYYLK